MEWPAGQKKKKNTRRTRRLVPDNTANDTAAAVSTAKEYQSAGGEREKQRVRERERL